MTFIFIYLASLGLLSFIIIIILVVNKEPDSYMFSLPLLFIFTIIVSLIILAINSHIKSKEIKIEPIEVYRGNTELIINGKYINSVFVPIDSTVVLKEIK